MIATGGLLRINARRQDSLKNKSQKEHTHKKKKKKRRSEVVVVKGKLKVFSVSGLVAALGILVLLVGVVMAALGYWPREGLFFSARPQEGAAMASVSTSRAPVDVQVRREGAVEHGGERGEDRAEKVYRGGGVDRGGGGGDEDGRVGVGFNQTEKINGTSGHRPRGFLEDFLDRYLYSDRLKVLGPLIMGIGIFLFICANAVLHENRDKKTKVINLRDIYSTVIDLHSLRKPNASSGSSHNPLNGLINYVQSKSLETKPRQYPASLMNRREGGGGGEGGGAHDTEGGDSVFSIYQEEEAPAPPPSSDRLSLPPSFSPPLPSTYWTSFQKEAQGSFTLPLRHPRPPPSHRRHSARAGMGRGWGTGGEKEQRMEEGGHRGEVEEMFLHPPHPLCASTPPLLRPGQGSSGLSCSSSSLNRGPPGGSQAMLLLSCSSLTPSHLSLSSLSHLLSSYSSTLVPPCRRRSLPSSSAAGYSKLTQGEDESFESTEMTSLHLMKSQEGGQWSGEVTSHRKFSNREKLRMISQADDQSGVREPQVGGQV
ncbi:transmembrane protein 200A-like [Labrus mixtus]|uniref:transmembrane protein 200A-like n=1 Tax=Labrus mixtus TaxID=508554 RepID=UPI0029C0FED6|nr:transmembrane protein 200A-like [Labrus mixtus]